MIYSFQLTFGYNIRSNNSGRLGEFIVYVAFSHVYFRRQKFSFQTYLHVYGTKNRRQKPAPENGVDLWRRFLERVSWVLKSIAVTTNTILLACKILYSQL